MYLTRLIDYAKRNNVNVYDNAFPLTPRAVAVSDPKREVFLADGQPRYVRAYYLARALEVITGRPTPDLRPKSDTACHGTAFGAALR